jgi:hypothetical protein
MSADGRGAAYSTSEFFEDLDREFTNLKTIEDETFRYKGADVVVQGTWELPIIIQWPGSSINFEFSTKGGGIEFGIVFVPALEDDQDQDELNVETVEEMSRVRSDAEKIEGTFSPPSEGVVFFLWDNTYDWTAVKKLSYSVDVFQVSTFIIHEGLSVCYYLLLSLSHSSDKIVL